MYFISTCKCYCVLCFSFQYGDDFVLAMFGTEMLFTFSAPGLEALYKIKEVDASFTEATRAFLGLKLPVSSVWRAYATTYGSGCNVREWLYCKGVVVP